METKIYSDAAYRDSFILGAAKAFFVSAYADFADAVHDKTDPQDIEQFADLDPDDYPRATCGADWVDFAPELPPQAYALAGELWARIELLNKKAVLFVLKDAAKADGCEDLEDSEVQDFGHYAAMQAMGHGVSWFDYHNPFPLELPDMDVSWCSFDWDAYKGSDD